MGKTTTDTQVSEAVEPDPEPEAPAEDQADQAEQADDTQVPGEDDGGRADEAYQEAPASDSGAVEPDPEPEAAPEPSAGAVTFVVRGQAAPAFTRAPAMPKTGLCVMVGGKRVQFVDGEFTTTDKTLIAYLDGVAERHSDGVVRTVKRETPDGVETFSKWDAYGEVRADSSRNTLGICRKEARA